MLLAAKPAIAPLRLGSRGAPFRNAAMNIASGPVARIGISVTQLMAFEPTSRPIQSDDGIASSSAATPAQSSSNGNGNNIAHQPRAVFGPVLRNSAPTVTTASGRITTNL